MSDLRELYQQLIIDHGRHPRNFGELKNPSHLKEGFNPLCGDKVMVYVLVSNNTIDDIKFNGCGCAISLASASLMTQFIKGKSLSEAQQLFSAFLDLVKGEKNHDCGLGKLEVLAGVAMYPARVKCATLCWHTFMAALTRRDESITTE